MTESSKLVFCGEDEWESFKLEPVEEYKITARVRPYKCPVCDGAGLVSRPPHIAGDVYEWPDSQTGPYPCKSCSGTGILWGT